MSEAETLKFEEDLLKERSQSEQLLLYLGDFDGPIDMLLSLARDQKVDLSKISILALANILNSSRRRAACALNWPPTIS